MNRLLALVTALVLLLAVTACGTPAPAKPESPVPVTSSSAAPVATPITDEAVLNRLWDGYLSPGMLLLNEDTEDLTKLSPCAMTEVAFTAFITRHDFDDLPMVTIPLEVTPGAVRPRKGRLWTLEQATQWVQSCFGMTLDNPVEFFVGIVPVTEEGPFYLPEQQAIAVVPAANRWFPQRSYDEGSAWDLKLEGVIDNGDGTITATLYRMDSRINKRSSTAVFVLSKQPDGEFCFKAARKEHHDNKVANPQGSYRAVAIPGVSRSYGLSSMCLLWQDGDSVILRNEAGWSKQNPRSFVTQLLRLNTKTAQLEALTSLETSSPEGEKDYLEVHGTVDGIVVSSCNGVRVYDLKTLELVRDAPLPDSLAAKIIPTVRETTPEKGTFEKEFFAGLVMTADSSRYYYSNHEGLFAGDTAAGSERLLIPASLTKGGAINTPRGLTLAEGDSKLIYSLYGNSGGYETSCLDLATGKSVPLISLPYIPVNDRYGVASTELADNDAVVTYVDYVTATLRTVTIAPPAFDTATHFVDSPLNTPVSRGYLLTGINLICSSSAGQSSYHLYRVKLEDMSVEKADFSIGTYYYPIGITDEGTAIISYHYSQGEYGLLLVD